MTPLAPTSTILVDWTEQENIPDVSTLINQKPTPKQDELNVAIGAKKDILLILHKKCHHGLLTQEDRKGHKSHELKLV